MLHMSSEILRHAIASPNPTQKLSQQSTGISFPPKY